METGQHLNVAFYIAFVAVLCFGTIQLGCGSSHNELVERLDRERGIEGYVLGDSLYPQLYDQAINDGGSTIEHTILSTVIMPSLDFPHQKISGQGRFLFGMEVQGARAQAIDGELSAIRVLLGRTDSIRHREFRDSLRARYGPPTAKLDTTLDYFLGEGTARLKRWKGDQVWLQSLSYNQDGQKTWLEINVHRRDLVKKSRRLSRRADTLLLEDGVGTLKKVGAFPLQSTKSHPMVQRVQEESLLGGTDTEHVIDFERLKPFFEVANPANGAGDEQLAKADPIYFESDETEKDSLGRLYVSISEDAFQSYRPMAKVKETIEENGLSCLRTKKKRVLPETEYPYGETTVESEDHYYCYGQPFSAEVYKFTDPADTDLRDEGIKVSFKQSAEVPSDMLPVGLGFPSELLYRKW